MLLNYLFVVVVSFLVVWVVFLVLPSGYVKNIVFRAILALICVILVEGLFLSDSCVCYFFLVGLFVSMKLDWFMCVLSFS